MRHAQTAYQYAKTQGWTPEQVEDATRQQVATACGVTLPVDDPSTFLAWNIKNQVARRLRADIQDAIVETRRAAILGKIQELAGEHNATAEFVGKDRAVDGPCIVIRRAK